MLRLRHFDATPAISCRHFDYFFAALFFLLRLFLSPLSLLLFADDISLFFFRQMFYCHFHFDVDFLRCYIDLLAYAMLIDTTYIIHIPLILLIYLVVMSLQFIIL